MAIVSYTYYTTTYGGTAIAEADWDSLEAKAETLIDTLTGLSDYSDCPESVITAVKNAVCAQVDYMDYEGVQVGLVGTSESSYTLGKIRVDGERTTASGSVSASMICPLVRAILEPTGLLYRGIPVITDGRLFV